MSAKGLLPLFSQMRGANFRDESRPIFVVQAVLWPNFVGLLVLWSDHGGGKYIALTTPRFFFVFQMVDTARNCYCHYQMRSNLVVQGVP